MLLAISYMLVLQTHCRVYQLVLTDYSLGYLVAFLFGQVEFLDQLAQLAQVEHQDQAVPLDQAVRRV